MENTKIEVLESELVYKKTKRNYLIEIRNEEVEITTHRLNDDLMNDDDMSWEFADIENRKRFEEIRCEEEKKDPDFYNKFCFKVGSLD